MDKAHNAPGCTARSKRSGQRCRAPAVKGWRVCRMHGALVAHLRASGMEYRHGARTKEPRKLIWIGLAVMFGRTVSLRL